jgi:hypothetical protein
MIVKKKFNSDLEINFRAHCSAVGDNGLVVGVLAVPAVELHAAAASE